MDIDFQKVVIRKYAPQDRADVRRISYDTACLGRAKDIIDDRELLADMLTLYFTDYEPESCFVAVFQNRVVGYLIGTKNSVKMNSISTFKIIPSLIFKAIQRGIVFQKKSARFLFHVIVSFLKGEFRMASFCHKYPAIFHINIDPDFRGYKVGDQLVDHYFRFLKSFDVTGVHVCTMSDRAKDFMTKCGLEVLYKTKRSYLRYLINEDVPIYILGKRF